MGEKQKFFEIVAKSLIENYYVALEIDIEMQEIEICNIGEKKYSINTIIPSNSFFNEIEIGNYIIDYMENNISSELMPQFLAKIKIDLSSTKVSSLKSLYDKDEKNKKKLNLVNKLDNYYNEYLKAINNFINSSNKSIEVQNKASIIHQKSNITYYKKMKKVIETLAQLTLDEQIQYLINKDNLIIEDNEGLLIIRNKEKVEINLVNNISNFLKIESENRKEYLKAVRDIGQGLNQIYYRGNKINFDLSTSLYRKDNDNGEIDNPKLEHIINNRIIQSMPTDFEKCESFFDKLTILKHFNCPSRLLDITKNPLIAAFFALDNYKEKKSAKIGQIHCCFPKSFKVIKNSKNSDSVSLLSALCTTDKNYIEDIDMNDVFFEDFFNYLVQSQILNNDKVLSKTEIMRCKKYIQIIIEKIPNIQSKIINSEFIDFAPMQNILQIIKQLKIFNLDKITKEEIEKFKVLCIDLLNNKKEIKQFLSELQHQSLLINPTFNLYKPKEADIDTYYIVHPSLNNLRIRNQEGLFILVGAKPDINNMYFKTNETYKELFETNFIRPSDSNNNYYYCENPKRLVYLIDNRDDTFYEDLSTVYGINKGFIYPELETKITQIKDDVKREYKYYNID